MHYDIFYGVDGTGTDCDETYRLEFSRSFTKAFHDCYVWDFKRYDRGPTFWGMETGQLARTVFQAVSTEYRRQSDQSEKRPRIFLTGYSRGGAAVLYASKLLKEVGIPVYALFLFDAVDRSATVPFNWQVPSNVAHARHSMRHPAAFSRITFGNCGTVEEDKAKTDLLKERFFCTHGAMGGLHYKAQPGQSKTAIVTEPTSLLFADTNVTFAQDKAGAEKVAAWMQMHHDRLRA